jgi:hypothetical protein
VKGYRVPKTQGYTSKFSKLDYLVGGLEPWNFMTFHSVGNLIIPTDELIFFRGVGIPPTSNYKQSPKKTPFMSIHALGNIPSSIYPSQQNQTPPGTRVAGAGSARAAGST